MKNLIIHPTDASTDFLKPIYANISEATIIHGGVGKGQIAKLISEHDRIIMMGHGSPSGLFSCAKFGDNDYSGFVIDYKMVPLLRDKECIAIWCNADKFMDQHELNGFYSGMFISEVGEAKYCGLLDTILETVTISNNYFSSLLGEVINEPLSVIYEHVMNNYELIIEDNAVANYNYDRLYLAE
jgi:hypothetical protein